ncbi:MAG: AAA family ATPase [Richelia sp. SM2_1_7]|nr:AAA family ATPase [Richelia sp. SM2_1_7]
MENLSEDSVDVSPEEGVDISPSVDTSPEEDNVDVSPDISPDEDSVDISPDEAVIEIRELYKTLNKKMILPTEKVKATAINPKKLVIFSKPKTGKSSLVAQLENNLIIDLENGTDYIDALKVKANNFDELREIINALKQGHNYSYITIDTITKLEDIILPYACMLYKNTTIGKNYKGDNVLELPKGAGYLYVREAFMNVINTFAKLVPNLILIGHLKDVDVEKEGKEITGKELDLTGKLKSILGADVDAIGLLYRGKNRQNILTFKTNNEVVCGARPNHLKDMDFVVSELTEEGLITYWDKIFI